MKAYQITGIITLLFSLTNATAANLFSLQTRDLPNTRVTVIDQQNGTIQLRNSTRKHLEFYLSGPKSNETWQITFDAPNHEDFHPGIYNRVTEKAVDNHAGVSLLHNVTLSSAQSFVIKELKTDESGNVVSVAVNMTPFFGVSDSTYMTLRYQSDTPDDIGEYAEAVRKNSMLIDYLAPGGTFPKIGSERNDDYHATLSMDGRRLRIYSLNLSGLNDITIDAPQGKTLEVGKWYEDTSSVNTSSSDNASICINGGCSDQAHSRFIIRQLYLNKYYDIKKLAIDFEYPFNQNQYPTFGTTHGYGAIRYNSTVPINVTPISSYDENTKRLTVPLAANAVGFPKTYYPVKLVFELIATKPLKFKLIEMTPVDLKSFDKIAAPSGFEDFFAGTTQRMAIPKIISPALFGDDQPYDVTLARKYNNKPEFIVGEVFDYIDKKAAK